ncbi:hypothetical protein L7F22_019206 [Adiantum nelumboides]|nr:hypothetical protein [Adiantum nelumboides]
METQGSSQIPGDKSQSSQRSIKSRRHLSLKKPATPSQKKGEWQRKLHYPKTEERSDFQSKFFKRETKDVLPRNAKMNETVIDLCSDDEDVKTNSELVLTSRAGDSEQKKASGQVSGSSKQGHPQASTENVMQSTRKSDFNSSTIAASPTENEEPAFTHDPMLQKAIDIENWQLGMIQDDEYVETLIPEDTNAMQQLENNESGMQENSSSIPTHFHGTSTSFEAESPNTTHSPAMSKPSSHVQGMSEVNVFATSSPVNSHPAIANEQDHPPQTQQQANENTPLPNQNDALANALWLLQLSQFLNKGNSTASSHLYIPEMTVEPMSEKQLGKRKATDGSRAQRLPILSNSLKHANQPTVTNEDSDEDPFAGVPHDPTKFPTTCHRCEIIDCELKMRCRMNMGSKICGLYFCKECCLEMGGEGFHPWIEIYCCPRCDQICDCAKCRRSRKKPSKSSSRKPSSSKFSSRKSGQGFKSVTQAYRDSVSKATARKRLPNLLMNISSSPPKSNEDVESTRDSEQSSAGSPWRWQPRNELADNFARYQNASTWGRTTNQRHLSDSSSEGIRRYNESSQSEDGRATPASSSVASLHVDIPSNGFAEQQMEESV